jgi:S1-C subfamily serine protease
MMYDREEEPAEIERRPAPTLLILAVIVGILLGGLAGAGAGYLAGSRASDGEAAPPVATAATTAPVTQVRVEQTSAIAEAIQKMLPSMVTLEVEGPERRDEFGRLIQISSVGSGVIIDARGYVVTNAHVIQDAGLITAHLTDGRRLPAVVVAQDLPFNDIALLRIQEGQLTAAEVGDSDALRLGEMVATLGTPVANTELPLAFLNSVTVGVVSGLGRTWLREGVVQEGLIQTDSALNHGNSGGALINIQGQLVGITSTVIREADTGDSIEGLGFALPINNVKPLIDQMIATGKVERPALGVVTIDVTAELAAANGLPVNEGAFVREVLPSGAAELAGIRIGDIIVRIAEQDVTRDSPLDNALKNHTPGDRVVVVVNRGGREEAIDVVLGSR